MPYPDSAMPNLRMLLARRDPSITYPKSFHHKYRIATKTTIRTKTLSPNAKRRLTSVPNSMAYANNLKLQRGIRSRFYLRSWPFFGSCRRESHCWVEEQSVESLIRFVVEAVNQFRPLLYVDGFTISNLRWNSRYSLWIFCYLLLHLFFWVFFLISSSVTRFS